MGKFAENINNERIPKLSRHFLEKLTLSRNPDHRERRKKKNNQIEKPETQITQSIYVVCITKNREKPWNRGGREETTDLDLTSLLLILSEVVEITDHTETTSPIFDDGDGGPPSLASLERRILRVDLEILEEIRHFLPKSLSLRLLSSLERAVSIQRELFAGAKEGEEREGRVKPPSFLFFMLNLSLANVGVCCGVSVHFYVVAKLD